MKHHVYIIYCPITRVEKYVGVSVNVDYRMSQHATSPHSDKIYLFMDDLKSKGKKPVCKIIKSFETQEEAVEFETATIIDLTIKGIVLLNTRHVKKEKPKHYLTDFED